MRNRHRYSNLISFIDLLCNLMLGFAAMFLLSLLILTDQANKDADIKKDAEFIVKIEWQPQSDHDVDLWIKDPKKKIIGFRNKETTFIFLERDNLGTDSDRDNPNHINEEILTIRKTEKGWYDINIHWYEKRNYEANPIVTIEVIKIQPKVKTIYKGSYELKAKGEEHTMFRFHTNDDAALLETDSTSQIKFVVKHIIDSATPNQSQ